MVYGPFQLQTVKEQTYSDNCKGLSLSLSIGD